MTPVLEFDGAVVAGGFTLELSMEVGSGEVIAVIGPNGAGKSTLLRAIAGLEPLERGRIELAGREIDAHGVHVPPAQRSIGIVFQDYRLFPHLSVRDNVAFGPRTGGRSRAQSRAVADEWLTRLGLSTLAERRADALSGGQAQRVALARALATDPALLLLDEPLAALDAGTRADLRSELRDHVRAAGKPTIIVTHDPIDALLMADRIVVLEAGHVTQTGTVLEVARRPRSQYVARLLGLNLLPGRATDTEVALDSGGHLHTADSRSGRVLVAVRPDAISLHDEKPAGSARNIWRGRVGSVEPVGDRVRVMVEGPPLVMVDVTAAAVAELGLGAGRDVWLSTKATELEVYPDHAAPTEGGSRHTRPGAD